MPLARPLLDPGINPDWVGLRGFGLKRMDVGGSGLGIRRGREREWETQEKMAGGRPTRGRSFKRRYGGTEVRWRDLGTRQVA